MGVVSAERSFDASGRFDAAESLDRAKPSLSRTEPRATSCALQDGIEIGGTSAHTHLAGLTGYGALAADDGE